MLLTWNNLAYYQRLMGQIRAAIAGHRYDDFAAETLADFMEIGHIMTATPPINAIPAVVAAAPGIATYNDLPLTLPFGVAAIG